MGSLWSHANQVALFCFLLAVGVYASKYLLAAFFAFTILLLLMGPRFDYWLFCRRFRKSPFYNLEVEITLTGEGVRITTSLSDSTMTWHGLTSFRRTPKGFVLYAGKLESIWLPDHSLREGTVEDVNGLLVKFPGAR